MRLNAAKPVGLFLTGDISSGFLLESDLNFLARSFDGPIYFVLGNHDYHKRHIESVHADVRRLCNEHANLHWMTDEGVISLDEDVALIGTEGWYDARLGDPRLLKFTFDWFLTMNFLQLENMDERIRTWQTMAQSSASLIEERLLKALDDHKTVYVLTHFPPWKEACRSYGTFMEKLWLPYNTNQILGETIEKIMANHKKKRVVVLAGHTHEACHIRVRSNIECIVARASYWGRVKPEKIVMI